MTCGGVMKHTSRALAAVLLLGSFSVAALTAATVVARGVVAALSLVVPGLTGWVGLAVALVGVTAIIATLVVNGRRTRGEVIASLGIDLPRSEQTRLWQEVEGLSGAMSARRPDSIRLVSDLVVEMHDHSSWFGLWPGHRELRIGAPFTLGFSAAQLRALIAHEIGHYNRRDAALPEIILRGREAVHRVAADGRPLPILRPFMGGFARLYDALTRPVVVDQEIRADELAAELAGRDALLAALGRLPSLTAAWTGFLRIYVSPGHDAGARPEHLYDGFEHFLADPARQSQMADIQQPLVAAPREHLVPENRIELLRGLATTGPADQGLPASILVDDLVHVFARLEGTIYDSSGLAAQTWEQLAHHSHQHTVERGAAQLAGAVARLSPAPTSLRSLLAVCQEGKAAMLVEPLAPEHARAQDRLHLAGHLVGDVIASRLIAVGARFHHSWDRQPPLVLPSGEVLDPWTAATSVARAHRGAPELGAWLAAHGVDIDVPLLSGAPAHVEEVTQVRRVAPVEEVTQVRRVLPVEEVARVEPAPAQQAAPVEEVAPVQLAAPVGPQPTGAVVAAAGPVTGDVPGLLVLTGTGLLLRRGRRSDRRHSATALDHIASLTEHALVHDHRTQTIPWNEISAAAYVPAPLGRSALVVRLGKRRSVTITFGPETEEYGDLPSALVAFLGPRFVVG